MPNYSPRINKQAPDKVIVGRIGHPWGFKGYVKVEVLTDFPHRFKPGALFTVSNRELTCKTVKHLSPRLIALSFFEVDDLEDIKRLRGGLIEVGGDSMEPLPEGTYYHYQLIGLRVETVEKQFLGCITDIIVTGANDVYVVNGADGEILLPAISEVIHTISLEHNRMTINPIPPSGLHSLGGT